MASSSKSHHALNKACYTEIHTITSSNFNTSLINVLTSDESEIDFDTKCRFHSLHHTQFRTNYSLFMPIYDYIYGTVDKNSDSLYENSLLREEEVADVVHLSHLTTPQSIYHMRLGLATVASQPFTSKWWLTLLWPFTSFYVLATSFYGHIFVYERNTFKALKLQSWVIPRFNLQVSHYY